MIFLGGTCGNNPWRKTLIKDLQDFSIVNEFFDPVVENWTKEDQRKEDKIKRTARKLIYFLGSPMMEGNMLSAYSIVEATMGLYDNPDRTIIVFDRTNITGHCLNAFIKIEEDLSKRFPHATIFTNYNELVEYLKTL